MVFNSSTVSGYSRMSIGLCETFRRKIHCFLFLVHSVVWLFFLGIDWLSWSRRTSTWIRTNLLSILSRSQCRNSLYNDQYYPSCKKNPIREFLVSVLWILFLEDLFLACQILREKRTEISLNHLEWISRALEWCQSKCHARISQESLQCVHGIFTRSKRRFFKWKYLSKSSGKTKREKR